MAVSSLICSKRRRRMSSNISSWITGLVSDPTLASQFSRLVKIFTAVDELATSVALAGRVATRTHRSIWDTASVSSCIKLMV